MLLNMQNLQLNMINFFLKSLYNVTTQYYWIYVTVGCTVILIIPLSLKYMKYTLFFLIYIYIYIYTYINFFIYMKINISLFYLLLVFIYRPHVLTPLSGRQRLVLRCLLGFLAEPPIICLLSNVKSSA